MEQGLIMGIRFFCPQGHRLNVKSFLAGKRGVCPDCGASVNIPMQSDARAASKKRRAKGSDDDDGVKTTAVLEPPEVDQAEIDISLPTAQPPSHDDFAIPPSLELPSTALPSDVPPEIVTAVSKPQHAFDTFRPAPSPNGRPRPAVAAPIGVAVAAPVLAEPAAAVSPAVADPIAEAPMAIWYVRPTSGGQYGPARGDVMRKWLEEGRVTVDSLVWREGWSDWRAAAKVFPDLGNGKNGAVAKDIVAEVPVVAEMPRRPIRPARKASTAQGIGIVITLGVVCVGLFVALIWVLASNSGTVAPTP
jgi:hypothetical protein